MEGMLSNISTYIVTYGIKLIGALAIFIIGKWVAKKLTEFVKNLLKKSKVDETLISFLGNLTYIVLMTFVIIAALNNMGVQTASLIAIFGAAGLAVGLALQGSLSNFAAGVILMLFRPIKVGDLVEVGGAFGYVEEIAIFVTTILTTDAKTIIVPNSNVTGNNIVNYSTKGYIRINLVYGIHYGDDILKAKNILQEIMDSDDRVLKDPPPAIAVMELGDSGVNFAFRPHVKVEDYWDVYFAMTEKVKLRFDEEGITIPFPQRDVHLFNEQMPVKNEKG